MAEEINFYEALDEILDDLRAGYKQSSIVTRLDSLYAQERRAEVERLRAEQRDNAQLRIFQVFTGASADAMDLNAMTAAQLTEFVMAAIRSSEEAKPDA